MKRQSINKVVVVGDFNSTILAESKESGDWEQVLGHNNSDRIATNNNGERLLMWYLKNKIKLANTLF